MNTSVDVAALIVVMSILALVFRAAKKTPSSVMRTVLLTIAALVIALMLWNLATHGGFHTV